MNLFVPQALQESNSKRACPDDVSSELAAKVPPKPRSMQSRFILMEGGTVALGLLLMAAALGISLFMQRQFSYEAGALQQQIILHSRIHTAFDKTVLGFWRYYGSRNPSLLDEYRKSEAELVLLTSQFSSLDEPQGERQDAANLAAQEFRFLRALDHAADEVTAMIEPKEQEFDAISAQEFEIRKGFTARENKEFDALTRVNRKLGDSTAALRVLLLISGIFPIMVMMWFQRAHARHIWSPLERLREMVLEVKRGNLNVSGEAPENVELGSLTTSFLAMASELREMRDSLEEKVRLRAAQLEAVHQDLLQAAKLASLGQLVSGVAHEINNPLTSILGFSEVVLSRDDMQPSAMAHVQTIRNEAMRLKHVVANLSRFARRAPHHVTRFDLRTVPDRLLQLRSYQLAANNITLRYERPATPVWVKGEPDAVLQILLQLTLNAEQAIQQKGVSGEILVTCEEVDGHARLSLEDNGCGMSPEMRERIFDPFFTTRGVGQGMGLGISHGIVAQHGGMMRVESEPGKGSTIHVVLPLTGPAEPRTALADSALQGAASASSAKMPGSVLKHGPHRSRYLVIDDEPEILELVCTVFQKNGTEVVALHDSAKLEETLAKHSYDLVLCDLKMPGPDGLAVLRMLREIQPELARHFLLMTGNLADADKAAIELEGVPILPKPFTLARLREAIEKIAAEY